MKIQITDANTRFHHLTIKETLKYSTKIEQKVGMMLPKNTDTSRDISLRGKE